MVISSRMQDIYDLATLMQDNILTHKAIRTGNLASLVLNPGATGPDDTQGHNRVCSFITY